MAWMKRWRKRRWWGGDPLAAEAGSRPRWEFLIVAAAIGIIVWLALGVESQALAMDPVWRAVLLVATIGVLAFCAAALWKRTRFSQRENR